jgi:Flp pilus assembly protein TadD
LYLADMVFSHAAISEFFPRRGARLPASLVDKLSIAAAVRRCSHWLRCDWFRVLVLVSLAVVIHTPALQGDRIWDDNYLAYDNPFIRSPVLILEVFRHYLFLDSFSAHYRPVQNISYMVDYFFWNSNTFGFHLTNVVLHTATGVLLYFLLRQLFASLFLRGISLAARARFEHRLPLISTAAFFVAMIWVVHPVHSAAVDYISGRADSLAFLFSAGGWLLFLRAQRTTRPLFCSALYFLGALCGLLALLSREIAGVWIILFIAHLLLVEKQLHLRTRICTIACSALLVAVYIGLRHLPEQRPPSPLDFRQSAPVRFVLMARALGDYGRLMIFPANLHMERTVESDQRFLHDNADWRKAITTEYLSILGLAVFAILILGCIKKGRAQPVRVFGATWFLVSYLPISNIVQLNATAAEHWLYLPSVGFLIWLFGCTFELARRYRGVVLAVTMLAAAGLGLRSFLRSSDWANEETFYRRTFEAGSRSARVAINLGQVYANRGAYARAEEIFRSVLAQNPNYPTAQTNLAAVLYHEGKIEESEKLFAEVEKNSVETRKVYPRTWFGALNVAKLRHGAHDNATALALLERTRQDYPEVWDIVALEAEILRQTKGADAALPLVEGFVRNNWWHHEAALALGRLYAQKGDAVQAETALRHASRLDVHDAQSLSLMATIKLEQNQLDDACCIQRRAIAREPDEPRQYILLSNILEKMGRDVEARAALAHVSHLREFAHRESALLN